MKFHIVRNSESLEDIMFLYNLTKDEIVEENRHIRRWDRLIPGTKLKIPPISEAVEQDVNDMEPFVEDYYPKLNLDDSKEVFLNTIADQSDEKLESIIEEEKNPPVEDISMVKKAEKVSTFEDYQEKHKIENQQEVMQPVYQPHQEVGQQDQHYKELPQQPYHKELSKQELEKQTIKELEKHYQKVEFNQQLEKQYVNEAEKAPPKVNIPEQPKIAVQTVQPIEPCQPTVPPNYLGYNNYPRLIPYSIIYYPVYIKK